MVPQPYRSELPDFLISMIDQIIKIDQFHVLRIDFLHYPLHELVYSQAQPKLLVWLFADPKGENHLVSKHPHPCFPSTSPTDNPQVKTELVREVDFDSLKLECTNLLVSQLQADQLQDIRLNHIISIDQIRIKCEANIYTSPLQLDRDIKTLIAWNQLFRASSFKTFQYLSILFQKIIAIIVKKDLFRKFHQIKQNDLARLMKYQTQFKTNSTKWPVIPTSFREYQEINRYVPTPSQRTPIINQRLLSKKVPVQCQDNCVCFSEDKVFCKFQLLSGWVTDCPNRRRKIECNHLDEEKERRCKNSQIKKHNRKRCAGKQLGQGNQQPQIEERLTWGIDLFTRNVIYHCLPQIDIEGRTTKINNQSRKNYFIEHSLTKAMNFMGTEGYNLLQTCNYIKKHSEYNKQGKQQQNEKLFSSRDYHYADLLARNYELAEDKTGFRIHTKGKGAICIDAKGIEQGSFIVEYFGEIYQPWRWYDRQDFIKQVLKKKKLKNYIPEFYNIYLEKHPDEPLGYDILVVDPSKMGNFSSRFSHSCRPNCGTVITVSQGKYYIGMYAFRPIEYGEQLTFDYCSMTESNYEHLNSICLCGMHTCRGNYLSLSNNKIFNNLMDNRNCFYARNSALVRSAGEVTMQDLQKCAQHNIKQGFLEGTPKWIIRWMARVLTFIEEEGQIYRNSLVDQWTKVYPWDTTQSQQQKQKNIQLYSQTSKQDLIMLRFQNLITSVDKLKYFFSRNQTNQQPPIYQQRPQKIYEVLVAQKDSVLLELQECLIQNKCERPAQIIQRFLDKIRKQNSIEEKLFLFRLCCLIVSHQVLFITEPPKGKRFNYQLLSDIVYFYAFTHTYFSPTEYKSFEADEICVGMSDILGQKGHPNEKKQKSKKKYSGPFVWGQLASWYKQTIVSPQASLSQDRRGTLSYPLIKSIIPSQYPYEKHSRNQFHKILLQKPANSWPPAQGCQLSFKNPHKLYGTMLFQNVHSRQVLNGKLPKPSLLQSCLDTINSSLRVKLELFQTVQQIISSPTINPNKYSIISDLELDLQANVPLRVRTANLVNDGQPRKRLKRQSDQSI